MYMNMGLIGTPVSHTLSPIIYNYFIYNNNINGGYTVHDIKDSSMLRSAIQTFRDQNFRGINVTLPYKEEICSLCDELDQSAKLVGAVNTIKFRQNGIIGYNTDIYGIDQLFKLNNIDFKHQTVIVLGAGGAARATVVALNSYSGVKLIIANRDLDKANTISKLSTNRVEIMPYDKLSSIDSDIVINATSIGLVPNSVFNFDINVRSLAIDLQYSSKKTPFLSFVSDKRVRLLNGIDMLIMQAYRSFNIFMGKESGITIANIRSKLEPFL